jgi:hypothetical protein
MAAALIGGPVILLDKEEYILEESFAKTAFPVRGPGRNAGPISRT